VATRFTIKRKSTSSAWWLKLRVRQFVDPPAFAARPAPVKQRTSTTEVRATVASCFYREARRRFPDEKSTWFSRTSLISSLVELPTMQNADSSRAWLMAIGIFKLIKGLLLVVAGIAVFKLVHHDIVEVLSRWVAVVHVDPDNKYFHSVVTKLWSVDDRKLKEVGAGTVFYAGLFLTEGLGLVLRKTWAEYFTIIVTGSFIPVEVYLMTQHLTAASVVATLLNIGIVWYLVAHRLGERNRKAALGSPSAIN
jgi:uncharacterized membrane protein (DUF2068 family)